MDYSLDRIVDLICTQKLATADEYRLSTINPVLKGTKLVAVGVRGLHYLTPGRTYEAVYGCESGIFPDRPFVTVHNNIGEVYSCHLSRFVIKDMLIKCLGDL